MSFQKTHVLTAVVDDDTIVGGIHVEAGTTPIGQRVVTTVTFQAELPGGARLDATVQRRLTSSSLTATERTTFLQLWRKIRDDAIAVEGYVEVP